MALRLRYDGKGPAKLLEYNADTPTSVFETAVFQWQWLQEPSGLQGRRPVQLAARAADRGLEARSARRPAALHLAGMIDEPEDGGTSAIWRTAPPGRPCHDRDDDERSAGRTGTSSTPRARRSSAFKLYPWEWMMRDKFGPRCPVADAIRRAAMEGDPVQQRHLPLLWTMFPRHPNLLPAYFEDDPKAAELGTSYVRKPLYSREGANVESSSAARTRQATAAPRRRRIYPSGPRAAPAVRRQLRRARSWFAAGAACGLRCART